MYVGARRANGHRLRPIGVISGSRNAPLQKKEEHFAGIIVLPRLLFSRKRIILSSIIKTCGKRRVTKASVELGKWNAFSGVSWKQCFSETTSDKKMPTLSFRLCEAQILSMSKCIKLNYQTTILRRRNFTISSRRTNIQKTEMKRTRFLGGFELFVFCCQQVNTWRPAVHQTKKRYSAYPMSS